MLRHLYEQYLELKISRQNLPACVAVVLSAGDLDQMGLERLREVQKILFP